MSEPTDTNVLESSEDDWLGAPAATAAPSAPGESRRRALAVRAGLLAVGVAVGALVVSAVSHGSSSPTANAGVPAAARGVPGAGPGGTFPGGGPPAGGFGGGLAGEQHVSGTLTAIGASSVTVKSAAGSATYAITATSELVRNGSQVSLSGLKTGESVLVHVYPGSGSQLLVERLFAGTSAATAPGGGTST